MGAPDNRRHRRSLRLKGYDYTQPGAYFVTICTQNRACLFGDVVNGEMVLNEVGQVVHESWEWLGQHYHYVGLDEWVVMPNHLHGIIVITGDVHGVSRRGGSRTAPTVPTVQRKPLGRLIGAFKTVSTKRVNEMCGAPGAPLWQRNYYEHIIRGQESLNRIRQYILDNPARWMFDRENPNAPVGAAARKRPGGEGK